MLLLDWVLRVAIPEDDNGFLLTRLAGSRVPERCIPLLGYADELVIVSSYKKRKASVQVIHVY